ncbi:Glomulin [Camelus dromedarius]|uniref:Glomulin n=1 Tax=Camelus dromedarius TaxID=9838 RepID=A0A5N4DUU3_CAMDR|nr:Glomulin [Camelus dromedarius]
MAVEELQSIIKRCQILEEQDFKEEDFGLFQLAGQRCLDEGHIDQLVEIIQNEKNKVIVKNMGWNLVGPVVRCLLWNDKEDDKRKYYFLMLDVLVKLCNPKELLLGLLELIEEPSGKQISQIILLLLQPLQTGYCSPVRWELGLGAAEALLKKETVGNLVSVLVIQKLRKNKAYSVGLALSTLWSQLSLLPVPCSEEQVRADDHGLCRCCKALTEFAQPFVEEVTADKENSMENEKLKDELLKFCFKSLKCPLLTAQFPEPSEEAGNDPLRCFASEIIGFLSAIGYPFPKMIFNHGRKKKTWDYLEFEEEEHKQLSDSLASLAYLVFVQGISIDQLPMVLSPSYLLQFNMGHIQVLLQRTEESVFSKGLDLLENGLLRLEDNSLLHQYLEIKSFLTVPQRTHDNKWFTGPQLISLLDLVLLLPEGAETDLLQNSDRIMASLNLLRYLVIKDNENDNQHMFNPSRQSVNAEPNNSFINSSEQTGLWTELEKIEKNFLKPLHIGLNMSKAHYEAEIKNSQEVQKSKDLCSVTVGGEEIPNMPPEMQLKVLHSALFTFDLIESVLARVEELIEMKTKSTL